MDLKGKLFMLGGFLLLSIIIGKLYQSQEVPESQQESEPSVLQPAEIRTGGNSKQVTGQLNRSQDAISCGQDNERLGYYSQSNEDKALLNKFFLHPPVCRGTFVEIGALDGKTFSNTLLFERFLDWNGVLIEANPEIMDSLQKNRPNTINVGLSVCKEGENEVIFVLNGNGAVGGVLDNMSHKHYQAYFKKDSTIVHVPCKPMGQILRDAGIKAVDLFSIDVEGSEHVVLETMDWTIPVRVILIEMGHTEAKDKRNREYLEKLGFVNTLPEWNIMSDCSPGRDCAPNEVFVNPHYPQVPNKSS